MSYEIARIAGQDTIVAEDGRVMVFIERDKLTISIGTFLQSYTSLHLEPIIALLEKSGKVKRISPEVPSEQNLSQ